MVTTSSSLNSSTALVRVPFLTGLLHGQTSPLEGHDIIPALAKKDPSIFQDARQELPALKKLPVTIDTYEKLKDRTEAAIRENPVTHPAFGTNVIEDIKGNLKDVAWQASLSTILFGTAGFALGWVLGFPLGWSLGTVLNYPLAFATGDALSVAAIPLSAFLATRARVPWKVSDNRLEHHSDEMRDEARYKQGFKHVAPFTALAAGATFFATHSYELNQDGVAVTFFASIALSIVAAIGASFIATIAMPPVKQAATNVKTRFNHWNETRQLKKALRAFEKIGLSPERLTGKLSNDTKRLATFADGPLKAYLTEERDKLRKQSDGLKTELARVTAGKERKVLFKEQTPAEQRDRIMEKLKRAEKRLEDAIAKLENEGIAVYENILTKIPKLLDDITEWNADQSDVTELSALEMMAEDGVDKADDAEIMLSLSRERLGVLANRFQAMITDMRSARQAALEVERISPPIRGIPEKFDAAQADSDLERKRLAQRQAVGG